MWIPNSINLRKLWHQWQNLSLKKINMCNTICTGNKKWKWYKLPSQSEKNGSSLKSSLMSPGSKCKSSLEATWDASLSISALESWGIKSREGSTSGESGSLWWCFQSRSASCHATCGTGSLRKAMQWICFCLCKLQRRNPILCNAIFHDFTIWSFLPLRFESGVMMIRSPLVWSRSKAFWQHLYLIRGTGMYSRNSENTTTWKKALGNAFISLPEMSGTGSAERSTLRKSQM